MLQPVLTSSLGNLGWKPCFELLLRSVPFFQSVIQLLSSKESFWLCGYGRHLLCKCGDLSSNPQSHIKLGEIVPVCSPCAPVVRWGMETGGLAEAYKPASLVIQGQTKGKLSREPTVDDL